MSVQIERPVIGRTYYAPVQLDLCGGVVPIIAGEYHGVIVDGRSQDVAVVYSTRDRAERALRDVTVWHPDRAGTVQVMAVRCVAARRFEWAGDSYPRVIGPYTACRDRLRAGIQYQVAGMPPRWAATITGADRGDGRPVWTWNVHGPAGTSSAGAGSSVAACSEAVTDAVGYMISEIIAGAVTA